VERFVFTPLNSLAILGVGFLAGVVNILAGGGSFFTLPLLIFLGLPPNLANGTNRLAILIQNTSAVGRFMQLGVNPGRFALKAGLAALPGAILGAWIATLVSNSQFRVSLAFFMIIVTLFTLLRPTGPEEKTITPEEYTGSWLKAGLLYFLVGIYGGYIQAGVGFMVLAVITWQGLNLVHGNAVKLTIIIGFTTIALIIFASHELVVWPVGLLLGLGNLAGGFLGTRLAVRGGHAFVKKVVTVAVIFFALKLLFYS